MRIRTSVTGCAFLAVFVGLVPSQQSFADVVVDFSPDTTGVAVLIDIGNSPSHQQAGDKFMLSVATTIEGGSIFSSRNVPRGFVGVPVQFVVLRDEGGVPGADPVIDVFTSLDVVDTSLTTTQSSLTRKHASIPPHCLPAGTYWFFMKGLSDGNTGLAIGIYDDGLLYLGFPPPILNILTAVADVFFTLDGSASGDGDCDGVPDDEDCQPDSDLSPTVVIDGCDSGVENLLFDDGCTISDLIAECAAGANNHGQFVSCVAQLTNALKREGVISGQEKGAIQSCAAQADIP